jgi:hypothetical protein
VGSLRPLACDFRLLRFSRSASFSRSRRESFAATACRPTLSRSSVIAGLSEAVARPQNIRWFKPMHGHSNGDWEPVWQFNRVAGGETRFWRVLVAFPGRHVLAPAGGLWQEPAACRGLLGRFCISRARCRSSVVEHSIGNGLRLYLEIARNPCKPSTFAKTVYSAKLHESAEQSMKMRIIRCKIGALFACHKPLLYETELAERVR